MVLLSLGYLGQAEGGKMVHVQARRCFAHFRISGYAVGHLFGVYPNTDCIAGYFIKYLDQTNINSAFVSGMWVSALLLDGSITDTVIGKKI
jgi:hypothetical protein